MSEVPADSELNFAVDDDDFMDDTGLLDMPEREGEIFPAAAGDIEQVQGNNDQQPVDEYGNPVDDAYYGDERQQLIQGEDGMYYDQYGGYYDENGQYFDAQGMPMDMSNEQEYALDGDDQRYADDQSPAEDIVATFGTAELGDAMRTIVRGDDGSEMGSAGMTQTNLLEQLRDVQYRDYFGVNSLHTAAAAGDEMEIALLLDNNNLDPNEPDAVGRTPLFYTVASNSVASAKALLSAGATCLATDTDGRSVLHWAAFHGRVKILKVLLASETAQAGHQDKEGRTPLHWACVLGGSLKALTLLLKDPKAAAFVAQVDNEEMTPLHWACYHNCPKHVAALLKSGAPVDAMDRDGKSALHWACGGKDAACAKAILSHDKNAANPRDKQQRTPLHTCMAESSIAVAQALTRTAGCDINAKDDTGRTPAHWAAALNKIACVNILVKAKADFTVTDNEGATPLHYASQHSDTDVLCTLQKASPASMDMKDNNGSTALAWAVAHGNSDATRVLLDLGANSTEPDGTGRLPLHASVFAGSIACTKLLLAHVKRTPDVDSDEENKADIDTRDTSGQTALFAACNEGHVDIADVLLDAGASPHVEDVERRRALHWAAIAGSVAIVRMLVDRGADVSSWDNRGGTALHYATFFGHDDVVAYLCECDGVDINCQDYEGISPLHWAALKGHQAILQHLLDLGAYPNFMEANGNKSTPYDYAVSGGQDECAHVLASYGGVDYPAMQDIAAVVLQQWWRVVLQQRREQDRGYVEEKSATKLVAAWRGYSARKQFRVKLQKHREYAIEGERELRNQLAADDLKVAEEAEARAMAAGKKQAAVAKSLEQAKVSDEQQRQQIARDLRTAEEAAVLQRKRTEERERRQMEQLDADKTERARRIEAERRRVAALDKAQQAMARAAKQDAERKRRLIAATEAKVAQMEQDCEQQTVPPAGSQATRRRSSTDEQATRAPKSDTKPVAEAPVAVVVDPHQQHLSVLRRRKKLVVTEKRRIHNVRVLLRSVVIIQRAWRAFKAAHPEPLTMEERLRLRQAMQPRVYKTRPRRTNSVVSVTHGATQRPSVARMLLEPLEGRNSKVLSPPPVGSNSEGTDGGNAAAETEPSLYPMGRGKPLRPIRTPGSTSPTSAGSNSYRPPHHRDGTLSNYRKGAPRRSIKVPMFDSPDEVISKSAAKPTDTELEVAALTIQLYVRKFMARRRGKGYGPSFEVRQQATRVVDVYGNKAPLEPIVSRSAKSTTHSQGRIKPGRAAYARSNNSNSRQLRQSPAKRHFKNPIGNTQPRPTATRANKTLEIYRNSRSNAIRREGPLEAPTLHYQGEYNAINKGQDSAQRQATIGTPTRRGVGAGAHSTPMLARTPDTPGTPSDKRATSSPIDRHGHTPTISVA
eukprot:m.1519701 g.1519701  ORF g.1519701 m.1519701 type:complete len:1385 (-) comp25225_c2_seq2:179-4333(-)